MDREDFLRAFSEYNNKKACINWQPQKTLVRFLCLESDLPQSREQTKKKSSRKTITQPQGSRGKEVHLEHLQMLKETTQEIPVSTKKPGGGRARGHILSDGTEVL